MYSVAWVNKSEIKDMCIEFAIYHVSPRGNNVKIKLDLKNEESGRECPPYFW